MGLRNSGGPGEAWKTELRHQPSFERWLEERGKGPPSSRLPPPLAPLPPGCIAQESTGNAAQSSPAPRRPGEGIEGQLPPPAASDIPTPTQGCRRRALSAVAECHCSLFLLIRVDTAPEASPTPKLPRPPRVQDPAEDEVWGPRRRGGEGGRFGEDRTSQSQPRRAHSPPQTAQASPSSRGHRHPRPPPRAASGAPQGGGRYPRGGDWGGRGPGCAPGRAGRASWRRGGSGAGRRCLGLCALQPGAEEEEEAEEEKEAAAVGPGRGERGAADPGGWQRTRRRLRKTAGRPGLQQQRAANDWPGCRRG